MKHLIAFLVFLASSISSAQDLTLSEIRDRLEGKEVVMLGQAFDSSPVFVHTAGKLMTWPGVVAMPDDGYSRTSVPGHYAPVSARGQTVQVLKVVEAKNTLRPTSRTDAFGRPVSADNIKNPYITVVVQLPDGSGPYGATGYYSTLLGSAFLPVSVIEEYRREVGGALDALAGKTLYKLGYTVIYRADASLEDLLDPTRNTLARDRYVPNMTPLKVVETRYLEGENAVVIRVQLPSGESRVLFNSLQFLARDRSTERSAIRRMGILVAERPPTEFSSQELSAIRKGEIFRGMSQNALYASWGFPDTTNEWGRGGKQHIYGKTQFVYVLDKKISDWQTLR